MKVKFVKDFGSWKAGEELETEAFAAEELIGMGVAKKVSTRAAEKKAAPKSKGQRAKS